MTKDWDRSKGFVDLTRMVDKDTGQTWYMCQLCFNYFEYEDLADLDSLASFANLKVLKTDICKPCMEWEKKAKE